ncbi:zinc finger protein 316-like isoform X5 [Lethenteron reissneri]|uniref:zinc finger protein 316-like isoform X5 n=1 Tax=Lethenteron reissneri TaxID=7753 RepID=UPI002AB726C5|nr:zinc finger protein 316-like isoform X5 [Lethenteron reissneri]
MACAATASWSEDFPAWLEAQGVNPEVAQAMDSELGIRDYGVLRACVGDGLVRAELLATARDRLPFGFYAVLRQVVKALQGAEHHDGETTAQSETAALRMDLVLSSLVDVLVTLFGGLSRELSMSMEKLGSMDVAYVGGLSTPSSSGGTKYRPPEGDHLAAKLPNDYSNHNDTSEFTNAEDEPPSAVEEFEERDFNGESGGCEVMALPVIFLSAEAGEVPEASTGGVATGIGSVETGVSDQRSWYGVKMEACEDERSTSAASAAVESTAHLPSRRGAEGGSRHLSWGEPGNRMDAAPLNAPAESVGGKGGGFGLARGEASSLEFAPGGDEGNHPSWQGPGDPVAVATTSTQHTDKTFERNSSFFIQDVTSLQGGSERHAMARGLAAAATAAALENTCRQCGRKFVSAALLAAHISAHASEKPFPCYVCGRTFAFKAHLRAHQMMHTGEKRYRCTECDRVYKHYNSLKYHRQTRHTGMALSLPPLPPQKHQKQQQQQKQQQHAMPR